jgi:hypothetical protein
LKTTIVFLGTRLRFGVQGSVRLDQYDEPQPDLYLLRPRDDFYTASHAGPADILLIIGDLAKLGFVL